jgi:hypothetical protein
MNKIKDNLPLASAFLLILGAINLIYFYSFFNIDISTYIDLTEILSLSLPFFIRATIISIPLTVFVLSTAKFSFNKPTDENTVSVKVKSVFGWSIFLFGILYFYTILTGYLDYTLTWDLGIALFILLVSDYFMLKLMPSFTKQVKEAYGLEIEITIIPIIITMITISVFTIVNTRHNARNIMYKGSFAFAEVQLDSTSIHSDSTYRYIGKTKSYIFFYNNKTSKSDAYSLSDAKRLTIIDDHYFDGIIRPLKRKIK